MIVGENTNNTIKPFCCWCFHQQPYKITPEPFTIILTFNNKHSSPQPCYI